MSRFIDLLTFDEIVRFTCTRGILQQSLVASSGSRTVDLAQVKSAINRQHRQNNVRTSEPRELRPSGHQRQGAGLPRSSSFRQNSAQNKENKAYCNSTSNSSRSPYRNKYANVSTIEVFKNWEN